MKSIEQVRQHIAEEVGYVNWDTLVEVIKNSSELITFYTDMVASEYAEQALEESCARIVNEIDSLFPISGILDTINSVKEQLK